MTQLISTNPAKNYQPVGAISISTQKEIKEKVLLAKVAQSNWHKIGVKRRVGYLTNAMNLFKQNQGKVARLITQEMGMAITASQDKIARDFNYWHWWLDNAEEATKDEVVFENQNSIHRIIYEPIGSAAAIVPWNLPFGMFSWGVIPNLLVGNTVIFKISEECPLSGQLFEKIMKQSGLPEGVFSEIYGNGVVGEMLVNQDVDLIWFTGSSKVGKKLYEIAGKKFIKAVLELGGSNPGIVFEDVDVDKIVDKLYSKRFGFCGQTCDALKRLLVQESIFDEVVEKLTKRVEKTVVGQPEEEKTDMGPLVAKRQLDLLKDQVADAVKKGAKVITGGKEPSGLKGAYYLPTILTNIKDNMRVWQEEVFGPVLAIRKFKTEEEAIKLANDSVYGLGALVFTENKERAQGVARALQTGTVEINSASHWLPCNPFGGYKQSGMGREHGINGLRELCQIKVISEEK